MASFLWIVAWSVLLMVSTTISLSLLSKLYIQKNPQSHPVFAIAGIVFATLGLVPAVWMAWTHSWCVSLAGLFLIVIWMMIVISQLRGLLREGILWILCVVASLFVPAGLVLFTLLPFYWVYLILGTALYVMMRLFVLMDRVSELSMLTLLSQGILAIMLAHMNFIPTQLLLVFFYMFVIVMSISQTIRVFSGYAVLGPYAAVIAGFIAGYLWIYMMALGYFFIPLVLYSYDLFELLLAAGLTYWTSRTFYPFGVPFLLERAQESQFKPKKLTHFMFLILIILSFLSISNLPLRYIFGAEFFVLFSIYYMLKGWGVPKPSFRDLAADLKKGFVEIKGKMQEVPLKQTSPKQKKRKK